MLCALHSTAVRHLLAANSAVLFKLLYHSQSTLLYTVSQKNRTNFEMV